MTGPPLQPAAVAERLRQVVTPEGVPVNLPLALVGDRFAALLLDLLLIAIAVVVILVPLILAGGALGLSPDLPLAAGFLVTFLLRTFYFAFFELSWQGQTPGKRRYRLRAIDARGGPLTAEAIITRNLTREVELFLPLIALAGGGAAVGLPGWMRLVAGGWMLIFGLLPLFNRDRLRVGDLVAGTIVVRTPPAVLLGDLTADAGKAQAAAEAIAFRPEQLDVYGEYELQVLEQVLRDPDSPGRADALRAVAEKIRAKISWEQGTAPGAEPSDVHFLRAFYAALRARLEHRMLLGRRRRDKHAAR